MWFIDHFFFPILSRIGYFKDKYYFLLHLVCPHYYFADLFSISSAYYLPFSKSSKEVETTPVFLKTEILIL
jgi:hypothetical protein